MATVYYKDYRIEIQPFMIPQGWSARGQVWSFRTGTTRVEPFVLPTHFPFPSQEAAHTYAETVTRQWVDQRQEPSREHLLQPLSRLTQEEQRARAAVYGDHIGMANNVSETTAIDEQ